MKIYVASSWKNPWQTSVVAILREIGHEVYDFRASPKFLWSDITDDMSPEKYRKNLNHEKAHDAFSHDMAGLTGCDACVMVWPCGSSAHLELGYAVGSRAAGGRHESVVFFPTDVYVEPEKRLGHTLVEGDRHICVACNNVDGCLLPSRLRRIDPELMHACVDRIFVNELELRTWARDRLTTTNLPCRVCEGKGTEYPALAGKRPKCFYCGGSGNEPVRKEQGR
jgi:hypothetical protein